MSLKYIDTFNICLIVWTSERSSNLYLYEHLGNFLELDWPSRIPWRVVWASLSWWSRMTNTKENFFWWIFKDEMWHFLFSKDGYNHTYHVTCSSNKWPCLDPSQGGWTLGPLLRNMGCPWWHLPNTVQQQKFHWGWRQGHKKPCSSSLGILTHCL